MSDTELLHKSKPEPVRRLEVFTGRRRRTWPAEQKARILAESYESGEKVSSCAAARVDAAAAVSSWPGVYNWSS